MDVFALSRHDYLQPPLSKQGRHSGANANQQNQSNAQGGPSGNQNAGSGGSGGVNQVGANQVGQQTSFSTGMFSGNMNQSSSS